MNISTVEVPIGFGLDWPWCSVSFLITNLFILPQFASHYSFASVCIYLDHRQWVLHIPHGTAHIRIPLCTRTVSHHGPWNSLVYILSNYTHLTCRNSLGQRSAITETTVKQRPLAIIWFDSRWENPGFVGIHAIFSGINTHDASLRDIPSLFHILTRFVHMTYQFAH